MHPIQNDISLLSLILVAEVVPDHVYEVTIKGTKHGLGIRIVGGKSVTSVQDSGFGIFVKEIIRGSLAARDGRTSDI